MSPTALEFPAGRPTLEAMTKHRTVRDVMTTDVVSIHRDTAFKDIAALLAVHQISAVPVVDDQRRVLGVASETDLLSKESAHDRQRTYAPALGRHRALRAKAGATRAHDLMSAPPVTVAADTDVAAAARRMQQHSIRRMPVVDPDGMLLGIVSRRDLLRVYLRPDRDIAAEINDEVLDGTYDAHADVIDGVVVLRGQVPSRSVVNEAVARSGDVEGVIDVIEHLTCADDLGYVSRDH